MTALEEALDLLGDLATGSTRERATAMARGVSLLSSLSTDEKRELAVSVADKVAPHLVPVIEAETGMDLTPNQIGALLQMARQLDAEQVAELRAAVLDDDVRSDLAVGLAGTAARELGFDVPDDLSDLDEDVHLPPPAVPAAEPDTDPASTEVDGEADSHEPHELDLDPVDEEAELARYREELEAQVREEVVAAQRKVAEVAASEPEPIEVSETIEPVTAVAPVAVAPVTRLDEDDEPTTDAPPPVDRRLVERLRDAADAPRVRRSLLADATAEELWQLGAQGRRDVVGAFPDGWQRRRAVHHLLDLDVVSADEAVALARTVEDTASRRWVVASLVEAGLLDGSDLDGLVDAPTAARITARQGG